MPILTGDPPARTVVPKNSRTKTPQSSFAGLRVVRQDDSDPGDLERDPRGPNGWMLLPVPPGLHFVRTWTVAQWEALPPQERPQLSQFDPNTGVWVGVQVRYVVGASGRGRFER